MSEKFIDREYLLDSFKDYNTDIVEKKFDQINSNLGGLSFSVSGTTLSITDGENTWTLTQ